MDSIRSSVVVANPSLEEAHRVIRSEIPHLSPSEIESRLISFSLREIKRVRQRINKIPNLSPAESRALYFRLLRSFVIEHQMPDCAQPRLQGRAA